MLSLRPMEDTLSDYTFMTRWFHEPELQRFVWCDEKGEKPVSLARVIQKYSPRIITPTDVFPYFILLSGEPVGFIQYYFHSPAVVGLDMWLGSPEVRNRGYGSRALVMMVDLIRSRHPHVTEVFIDPEEENTAAVRCYQKAGFQTAGTIVDDGTTCLYMHILFPRKEETLV